MIQLTAAERALSMETQRRIDSTHAIQKSCTQKIIEMELNFQRILDERTRRMEERLASVQEKVEELSAKFEAERETVPKDMERTGQELLHMVATFQKELADERADRLNREGRILKQMDDHASDIITSIENESNEREQIAYSLRDRIATNEHLRAQNERDLQERIQSELSELRGLIDKEKQERKLEDDAIVLALNQYTKQLQGSLSVISS
jgi:predicted metal-dependent enzyme (double-stranded beta helix superfamily)